MTGATAAEASCARARLSNEIRGAVSHGRGLGILDAVYETGADGVSMRNSGAKTPRIGKDMHERIHYRTGVPAAATAA